MARYLKRVCPKCGGYFGVLIPEMPTWKDIPIDAACAECGFKLPWRVLIGGGVKVKRKLKRVLIQSRSNLPPECA